MVNKIFNVLLNYLFKYHLEQTDWDKSILAMKEHLLRIFQPRNKLFFRWQ